MNNKATAFTTLSNTIGSFRKLISDNEKEPFLTDGEAEQLAHQMALLQPLASGIALRLKRF